MHATCTHGGNVMSNIHMQLASYTRQKVNVGSRLAIGSFANSQHFLGQKSQLSFKTALPFLENYNVMYIMKKLMNVLKLKMTEVFEGIRARYEAADALD